MKKQNKTTNNILKWSSYIIIVSTTLLVTTLFFKTKENTNLQNDTHSLWANKLNISSIDIKISELFTITEDNNKNTHLNKDEITDYLKEVNYYDLIETN